MSVLAGDLTYLVALVAGELVLRLLAFVVLFTVVLAVRDGLARRST